MTDEIKKCTTCGRKKKKHLFGKSRAEKGGLKHSCKACTRKAHREWCKNRSQTDYISHKAYQLRSNWRTRAKQAGVDLSGIPTASEIKKWLSDNYPWKCYYTGVPLSEFGIDHKLPLSLGGSYSFDNLVICDLGVNTAKGDMTEEEFKQLLSLIASWPDGGKKLLNRLKGSGHIFAKWKRN